MQKLDSEKQSDFSTTNSCCKCRDGDEVSGPPGHTLLPKLVPLHTPSCPRLTGKVWEAEGQPRVKLRAHFSLSWPLLVTGPHAAAPCTAQAGSSHRLVSTGSRSAGLCLAPRPDRPPPMPPMGDTASPGPSHHAADLHPCTLLFLHLRTPNGATSVPLPHRDQTSSP